MRNHGLSIAREYRNERGNTYMQNVLRRDLSRASWWYRSHRFTSSIHTSSISRWKWLSLMRAANIIFPSEEYFMYQLCNSRILVDSLSINSGHIRGCPSTNGFLLLLHELGLFLSLPAELLRARFQPQTLQVLHPHLKGPWDRVPFVWVVRRARGLGCTSDYSSSPMIL